MNRCGCLYHRPNDKETEMLNKQKKKAKEILGTNFVVVYRFFRKVLESKYHYKIFRSRRCQVLLNIFAPIILDELSQEDPNIWERDKGIFISDNSLIKYKEDIISGKKSVLLVDDIMIHGRGLKQLYEMIDPGYKMDNIKIYILAKNHEECNVNSGILDRLDVELPVFEWGWKELSSQLVNLIYYNATPYISYVGSYCGEISDEKSDWNDKLWKLFQQEKIEWVDNTNDNQKQMNEASSVIFEKNELPNLFNSLCYACCLRIYENSDLKKRTLVPYIFLKNFSMSDAEKVSSFFAEQLSQEKFKYVCKDLSVNTFSDESGKMQYLVYKMRLVNALLSLFYGVYVADHYGLSWSEWKFDFAQFSICYGQRIAKELQDLVFSDFEDFIAQPVLTEEHSEDFCEDKELNMLFDTTLGENPPEKLSQFSEKLEKYFFENGIRDEKRAKIALPRKEGITINKILGYFSEPLSKIKLVSALLNAWDSGAASGNALASDGNGIIAMYVAAGEQCFRYGIKDKKKDIEYILKKYQEVFFRDSQTVKADIIDYINEQYSDNPEGKEELYSLIGHNLENLGKLNIPAILN